MYCVFADELERNHFRHFCSFKGVWDEALPPFRDMLLIELGVDDYEHRVKSSLFGNNVPEFDRLHFDLLGESWRLVQGPSSCMRLVQVCSFFVSSRNFTISVHDIIR